MYCRIILGSDKCGFVESQKKIENFCANRGFVSSQITPVLVCVETDRGDIRERYR